MASYQVLGIPFDLDSLGDEEQARTMINGFAMGPYITELTENYHRDIMAMDFNRLRGSDDNLRSIFNHVTSSEMKSLMLEMKEAIYEKDKQTLIRLHLVFLRKCLILQRELEDYLQKEVPAPNFKEYVEECLEEMKEKNEVTELEGKAKYDASCSGCNIF